MVPASMLMSKPYEKAFSPIASMSKRIDQLSADFVRHRLVGIDTVIVRQLAYRHPEGAEQNVPERKGAGEIGIAALFQRGVVPAVEHRRRQHVSERTQRPVQV